MLIQAYSLPKDIEWYFLGVLQKALLRFVCLGVTGYEGVEPVPLWR